MIDLYTWSTPNGRKISILLEELKVKYKVIPINIMKNEQFSENFLKISPNNKIPAILDNENNISLTNYIEPTCSLLKNMLYIGPSQEI